MCDEKHSKRARCSALGGGNRERRDQLAREVARNRTRARRAGGQRSGCIFSSGAEWLEFRRPDVDCDDGGALRRVLAAAWESILGGSMRCHPRVANAWTGLPESALSDRRNHHWISGFARNRWTLQRFARSLHPGL